MICLVGTAHIFDIGEKARKLLLERPAWAVGIELDEGRLYSLLYGGGNPPKGILGKALHHLEKALAELSGGQLGADMVSVYKVASELGREIYLIDKPIQETFEELKGIPFKERASLLMGGILSAFLAKMAGEIKEEELREMMQEFRKKFPHTYEILIERRNRYMAEKIKEIEERHGNVIAFVGMGHLDGLRELLPGAEVINLVKSLSFLSDQSSQRSPIS